MQVFALRGCTVERFVGIGAALVDQVATPTLVVAELADEAIVLGRHQRFASAIDAGKLGGRAVLRRNSGGRTIRVSPGTVGVLLALPEPGALTGERLGFDRFINRAVRGLLAGLTRTGAAGGANYFGRDFVSVRSQQVAVLGQDNGRQHALLEAFVATGDTLQLPDGLDNYVEHSDPRARGPAHASMGATFDALAEAIPRAYAEAHRLELVPGDPAALATRALEPTREDETGFTDSGVADVSIGFVEALVRLDVDRLGEARLRGDFLAPAFVVRALEASLVGCPLTLDEVGKRVDAAFHQPGAFVLGLRELRVLAEAVLAAAGALPPAT